LLFPAFAWGYENDADKTQQNHWSYYQRPMKRDVEY